MTAPIFPARGPSPGLDPAIGALANRLARIERAIRNLQNGQRQAQLAFSSVENGTLQFNDEAGSPQILMGLQSDGTHAVVAVNGSDQIAPSVPATAPVVNGAIVIWDGFMVDGSLPLSDFAALQVHVSDTPDFTPDDTTIQGTMPVAGQFGIGNLAAGSLAYVATVAVNQAGQAGPPSYAIPVIPTSVIGAITPGSITGGPEGLIAPGTIDATNFIANLVVAGIVDATLIQGAQFVAFGTQGEILIYNGLPEPGDLIASISGADGDDGDGNAYVHGIITYTTTGGVTIAQGWQDGGPYFASAPTEAGPYTKASGTVRSFGNLFNNFTNGVDVNGTNDPPMVTQIDAHTIVMTGRLVTPPTGTISATLPFGTLGAPFLLPASGAVVTEFPTNNAGGGQSGSVILRPNGNLALNGNFGNSTTVLTAGAFRF